MIEIATIDTTTAEQNFANIILEKKTKDGESTKNGKTEYKTIFLNGEWGTGKTAYLTRTEKKLTKGKFVFLKFWEEKDKRSPINIAFFKVHPIIFWTSKLVIVVSIIVSILMTPVINLGLSKFFPDWGLSFFGLIALIVAVFQIFKYQSDAFYSFAFQKIPTKIIKRKILIIDDFDRISAEKQEDIYKMFNILKGRLPIVFVGSFQEISKSEGTYLTKIIDQRIDLPLVIEPVNIWENYFEELSKQFNTRISDKFKNLFIIEKRNLRDQSQFNRLVNQEFFERKKKGHVQVEQQLVIIYISLFHPEILKELRSRENKRQSSSEEQTINDTITNLLESNDESPLCFEKEREAYFLYEFVINLSNEEAEAIVNNEGNMENELSKQSTNKDFLHYFQSNYSNFGREKKDHILNLTLKKVKEYQNNLLLRIVIQDRDLEIRANDEFLNDINNDKNNIKEWDSILENQDFDVSQKLFFFNRYLRKGFNPLSNYYHNLSLTSEQYNRSKRKDFYFLTYLSQNSLFFKLDQWKDFHWKILNDMPEEQYLAVLSANNILDNHLFSEFEVIPYDRRYTVYKKQIDQHTGLDQDYNKVIEKHIAPRLKELEKYGFIFNYTKEQ